MLAPSILVLGVLQENFTNSGCCFQLAECLYAVEDTLMRVLVDQYRDELGLSYADDGGHDRHCLGCKLWSVSPSCEYTAGGETYLGTKYIRRSAIARQLIKAHDQFSLVARTAPVKESHFPE